MAVFKYKIKYLLHFYLVFGYQFSVIRFDVIYKKMFTDYGKTKYYFMRMLLNFVMFFNAIPVPRTTALKGSSAM